MFFNKIIWKKFFFIIYQLPITYYTPRFQRSAVLLLVIKIEEQEWSRFPLCIYSMEIERYDCEDRSLFIQRLKFRMRFFTSTITNSYFFKRMCARCYFFWEELARNLATVLFIFIYYGKCVIMAPELSAAATLSRRCVHIVIMCLYYAFSYFTSNTLHTEIHIIISLKILRFFKKCLILLWKKKWHSQIPAPFPNSRRGIRLKWYSFIV